MKAIKLAQQIAALTLALAASAAYAQSIDTTSVTTQASGEPSAKALRAQDRVLSKAVRRSMTRTKGLDASGINVLIKHGVVTLAGSVPDPAQITLASSAAQTTAGVTSVNNQLHIREPGN